MLTLNTSAEGFSYSQAAEANVLPLPFLLSIWPILLPLCGFNHKLTKSILYHSFLHPNIHIMPIQNLIIIKESSALTIFPTHTFLLQKCLLELTYCSCRKIFDLLHIWCCHIKRIFLCERKLIFFWIRRLQTNILRSLFLFYVFLLNEINFILMWIKSAVL